MRVACDKSASEVGRRFKLPCVCKHLAENLCPRHNDRFSCQQVFDEDTKFASMELKRVGLTTHSFRRTTAVVLKRSKVKKGVVDFMGWSSAAMYTYYSDDYKTFSREDLEPFKDWVKYSCKNLKVYN